MSVSSVTTFEPSVRDGRWGGIFFKEAEAEARGWDMLRDEEGAQAVEIWRVEHKHWCGVTEIACTCGSTGKALLGTLMASTCPCWSGNEHGCRLHGPLAHLGAQPGKKKARAAQPRTRLSALAERSLQGAPA